MTLHFYGFLWPLIKDTTSLIKVKRKSKTSYTGQDTTGYWVTLLYLASKSLHWVNFNLQDDIFHIFPKQDSYVCWGISKTRYPVLESLETSSYWKLNSGIHLNLRQLWYKWDRPSFIDQSSKLELRIKVSQNDTKTHENGSWS